MVWRSLAKAAEHGPVEMDIRTAVVIFADIVLSFDPVRMALCADSYHGCQPISGTVNL